MESTDVYFHSSNKKLFSMEEFDERYGEAMGNINEKFGKSLGESSGWVLDSISAINLNVARYNLISWASYTPTPSAIAVKKAVVNKDQKCFLYCILAFLFPTESHVDRMKNYKKYLSLINFKGNEMPMAV